MTFPLRTPDPDRTGGFTLVELLVAMVIIGVLAAIALPSFLSQRTRGYLATVRSDLRNAATSNEAYAADNAGSYVAPGNVAALSSQGFRASPAVTITVVDDNMVGAGGGFCLSATHTVLGAGRQLYFASSGPSAGAPTETPCVAS